MVYKPISIVVPVKNREKLILRALDSVRHQSYRPIRLIVVDNDSSDSTLDVVTEWKRKHETDDFRISVLSENKPGAAAARNRGLREVDTEHLLFFDSDDVMLPDLAMTVMEEFDRHPKLDLIYWRTAVVNSLEEVIPKRFARFDLLRRHIYNGVLSTQAYALRTDLIRSIGGWDESLSVWDDYELGLRILGHSPEMKGIFRVLAHIYPQAESLTGTDYQSKAGKWEKALDAMERGAELFDTSVAERIRNMILYRRMNLAALYASEGREDIAFPLRDLILKSSPLSPWRRRLLRFIFNYTRRGGRAAYLLWD